MYVRAYMYVCVNRLDKSKTRDSLTCKQTHLRKPYIHGGMQAYEYINININIYIYTCMYVCMYVCMHV